MLSAPLVGCWYRLRNRIICDLSVTIAITVEGEPGQLLVSICYLLSQKIIMETQDLLLMVLLLSPGLLLSVTIMLTFAAGG